MVNIKKRERATKIVSTLGPTSTSPEMISKLFESGADVFRLNFSHGTHEDHKTRYDIIRKLEIKYNRPIGIIADLQGPKIRIGNFINGKIDLINGSLFIMDSDKKMEGDQRRVSISNPEIFSSLQPGAELLLDDGKMRLIVEKNNGTSIETKVLVGGPLSNHKGINIPGTILPMSPLTQKDRLDLDFALDIGVDWIALSFVQHPKDIIEISQLIDGKAGILTKLEKPLAIEHLEKIIELSDALMIARGDLGVEAPPEDVPGLQKKIIRKARSEGKPVIVATQMLESMISSPTPTRAEASDVATAVFDGADAVMLSAETAAGSFPVEAVSIMDRIIKSAEHDDHYKLMKLQVSDQSLETDADAITAAAKQVAQTLNAAAIVTFTTTGSTTLRAARERPDVYILGLTPDLKIARRLVIVCGVHSVKTSYFQDFDDVVKNAIEVSKEEGFAIDGQRLVITAGVPFGTPGSTNVLRIVNVN
ncbi:MAG TPA: pyruvate kinase [Alphaproteobacteria bacterium]|nr:pyruvate kinase [Alphaproteobacteria bacterium]